MHGVRRGTRPSEAQLEAERKRSTQVADVIQRALILRRVPLQFPLDEAFKKQYALVETALLSNPDEYTLWSFRREVLSARLASEDSTCADDIWRDELTLTMSALRNHAKAYPAWQHRVWLLSNKTIESYLSSSVRKRAVAEEEKLTRLMLSNDPRNFHGWAHRMRVHAIQAERQPEMKEEMDKNELDFVEGKINDDFANYSAWHHRSVLLPRVHGQQTMKSHIRSELHYVQQAFYTEPEVQSVWFYHRWLLAGAPAKGSKSTIDEEVLEDELTSCEELLQLEPTARHALQTKAHILVQLGQKTKANETLDRLQELVS